MSKQQGKIGLILIIVMVIITAILLSGGNPFSKYKSAPPLAQGPEPSPVNLNSCCENAECDPTDNGGKEFDFQRPDGTTAEYGLLKKQVTLREFNAHLEDSGKTYESNPIIINRSEGFYDYIRTHYPGYEREECGNGTDDQVWGSEDANTACTTIPNDSLLYVCTANCTPTDRSYKVCSGTTVPCYGQLNAVYDIYYSIPQYHAGIGGVHDTVPDVIKSCTTTGSSQIYKQVVTQPSPEPGKKSLQLKNIKVENILLQSGSAGWISPWCKPAIYLYPEKTSQIHVNVSPVGKMSYTDPQYPNGGWQVTASPNGNITYQNTSYPYLYYEAEIPNQNIQKPSEGFVIDYNNISGTLNKILPKLGLNTKEASAFKEYWIKVLPKASFYFIGIMPESNLDSIAPLDISPKPDKTIRVTLYFQALDQKIEVIEPNIETPKRTGFTVIEWGGIFQKDPNHPFSCFM